MDSNFNFKKTDEMLINRMTEKKAVTNEESLLKKLAKKIKMNVSIENIYPGVWSIMGLLVGVLGMYKNVENAEWIIPVSCILYYAPKHIIPFVVILISLLGMSLGIPKMVFLLIFSLITMVDWSKL